MNHMNQQAGWNNILSISDELTSSLQQVDLMSENDGEYKKSLERICSMNLLVSEQCALIKSEVANKTDGLGCSRKSELESLRATNNILLKHVGELKNQTAQRLKKLNAGRNALRSYVKL